MAQQNITNIPPPRVPFIDDRTGLISREWYRYLFALFNVTGVGSNPTPLPAFEITPLPQPDNSQDVTVIEQTLATAPASEQVSAEIDTAVQQTQLGSPPDVSAEINAAVQQTQLASLQEISAQIQQALQELAVTPAAPDVADQVEQAIQDLSLSPRPELGTLAAVQQDNVPWLQFNTLPSGYPTGPLANGTVYWDDADSIKTLNIVMEDSGAVIQHVGEETYYRVKASAPITDGQVVMFTGTVGASGGLLGAPATGLTAFQNEYIMGIATQDIPLNGWGYVTWFGEVKKIDTTGGAEVWADGDVLYYDPAVPGGLTKFVPTAPNPKVIVASVVHAATNGILFVRPTFGSALGSTDSNVEITGLTGGDLLQYDGVQSRWENVTVASVLAGVATAPVTKTADFTVAAGEKWIINNKSGSSCTATLPAPASNVGRELHFQNYQDQTLVSASANVVPLAGGAATTSILLAVAGDTATLVSDGTNWVMTQYVNNNVLLLE